MRLRTLPAALLMTALLAGQAMATAFSDTSGSRNATAIANLSERGVIGGYSDGTFRPNNSINRAELAKILVTATGANPSVNDYNNCFTDVTTEWFAPYVCYAKAQGWVSGYSDGSFHPSDAVNTAEAIKMILNAQGIAITSNTQANVYSDVDISAWYASFVATASEKGLLEIPRGTLGINNNMTRGGVAEMIYRALTIKATGAARFVSSARPQPPQGQQGQQSSGRPPQADLQKFLTEANAAADKKTLTKEEFDAALKALRDSRPQPSSQPSSAPPGGTKPPNPDTLLASAASYLQYTDSKGTKVYLALDASGKVIFKAPMAPPPGGQQPPQQ